MKPAIASRDQTKEVPKMLPLVALLAIAKTISPSDLQQAGVYNRYSTWKTLGELGENIRKDYKLPGFCLGYQQIGQPSQVAALGLRSTQNQASFIQEDDRMLVGSIGEIMTATMVARLIEQQKLGWKTTLEFALPGMKMQESYKKITIEQLLNHSSGLPPENWITQETFDRIMAKAETATNARKAYVTELLSQEPSTAGAQAKSSRVDYVVVGYIVERLIHQSYEWIMERNLFNPMKMSSATIEPVGSEGQVGSQNEVLPHILGDFGYAPFIMPFSKVDWIMAPAGAGLSCSVGDLLKFAMFHLRAMKGDAQVLTADSYKILHTAPTGQLGEKLAFGWVTEPQLAGETCFRQIGSDGTFQADVTLWPARNLAVVAMTNAGIMRKPTPNMLAILSIRDRFEGE